MTRHTFLYLTQLEEYDIDRIKSWLAKFPGREVAEIKNKLKWTAKIKVLNFIAAILFFLPPEQSVIVGLRLLAPVDFVLKWLIALLAFIKLRLLHSKMVVVAVTGSWGKTTTKSTLLHLIGSKFPAYSTEGNHNTLMGVSLDILKLPLNAQYFIAEIGAYYPGDIAAVARLLRPRYGIVTAIGPMHLERFGTLDKVLSTKMELAQNVRPDGTVYLPADLKQKILHIRVLAKNIVYFNKIDEVYSAFIKNLDLKSDGLTSVVVPHRLEVVKNGAVTVIDDTYNSNPAGFEMALNKLKSLKAATKILVTPGMIELGSMQDGENERLARLAGTICQHVIVVGNENKAALLKGLNKTKAKVHTVETIAETQALLPSISSPDTAVLFENDLPDHYF